MRESILLSKSQTYGKISQNAYIICQNVKQFKFIN